MQADRVVQPEMEANGNDPQAYEEHLLTQDARKDVIEENLNETQENLESVGMATEMEDSSSTQGLRNGKDVDEKGQNGSDVEEEEEEDEEEEEASEGEADSAEENDYEAQRRRNIERNQEMLRQLGLLASPVGAMVHSNGDQTDALTTSTSQPDTLSTAFVMTTPKRKYKPRQKRNIDTPTRTSSRLQTKSRRSYAENSFFKTLSPEEQERVLAEEKKARKKAQKAAAEAAENDEELKAARNQNKWVGSRLYDSDRGITCHQCRQKTVDEKSTCANEFRCHSPSRHHYCRQCLWNRYGEALDEVRKDPTWLCPSCRGVCNCSFCRKKRGQAPTGVLDPTILQKYSSVAEYLEKGRKERPAIPDEELRKMKEQIAREIEQGIRPSAPVPTSSRQAGEIDGEAKEGHFYVEAIVEHRTTPAGLEYLIKWLGYDYEANTWEPAVHLNCPHLIKEYHIRHKLPLVGKRGRKKKIVAAPTTSTSSSSSTTATTAAGLEAAGKEGEADGEGEEEEEEEEEEEMEEWKTRRPGRPKGRGIGAPRLVMGTGRGPRGAAGRKPTGEADGQPNEVEVEKDQEAEENNDNNSEAEAIPEKSRGRKRKVRDHPTTPTQRGGKARATKKIKRETVMAKAKSKTKAKAKAKEAIKKLITRATNKDARKNASSKKADVAPPKAVRKSPRRRTAATDGENHDDESSTTVATDAKEHRKSPRLAKRVRGSNHDKAPVVAVVEERLARRSRRHMASDNEKQEEAEQADKAEAGNEHEDGKEETEQEKPGTKSLYWDEPVEKGRRRRSAPLLLTDNLIILGNGQMRGVEAWTGGAQKRKAKDKNSTAKTTTRADKKSGPAKRKRSEAEEEEEEERQKKGKAEAKTAKKHGKKAKETKKTTGGKPKRRHDEQEGKESEQEQGNDGADEEQEEEDEKASDQTLYWDRPVPGKRRRAPNMAYFSDFVIHGARASNKRARPAATES